MGKAPVPKSRVWDCAHCRKVNPSAKSKCKRCGIKFAGELISEARKYVPIPWRRFVRSGPAHCTQALTGPETSLPPGWIVQDDEYGVYYLRKITPDGANFYIQREHPIRELPDGWERYVTDGEGRTYYRDNNNQTTWFLPKQDKSRSPSEWPC